MNNTKRGQEAIRIISMQDRNKLTKLGRCDRETIEWANNSNDSIVRTAGRVSK